MTITKLFSTILKLTQNLTENGVLTRRNYCSKAKYERNNLYTKVNPLGHPRISLTPVLDKWVKEGKKIRDGEIRTIIRDLRAGRRYTQALEVSEWVSGRGKSVFSPGDRAVQLDLVSRVRGIKYAENYFRNLDAKDKTTKTYVALLKSYIREGLVDKALNHMKKMKESGLGSPVDNYKDLMSLYTCAGQPEKVADVFTEMKENGIAPDLFCYRICVNSYAARSDLKGVEKMIEVMENQSEINIDWFTYSTVANIYVKAGLKEKAIVYLKKCEEKVGDGTFGYDFLISLYAGVGLKNEVIRLCGIFKAKCKKLRNRDYITMLGSLGKLGEFEEAEKLLQEWESSCQTFDFRVPNTVLIGYCQQGLVEKAEAMLRNIIEKQRTPRPNSWSIIAAGYVNEQNMEKAFDCMKKALAVEDNHWRPKPNLVRSILRWLGDYGNFEDVQEFIKQLEGKVPKGREIYHTLIKAHIRSGKQVDELLKSMKADNIDEDEETKTILSSRLQNVE